MFALALANAAGLCHSCVCVCVLGGGLHLDTAGVCGGTVANGDLFPCQTFKV